MARVTLQGFQCERCQHTWVPRETIRGAEGLPEVQKSVLEHPSKKPESQKAQLVLDALNTLAVSLTDHNHKWSKKERRLYFGAYRWLTSFCACGAGSAA